MPTIGHAEIWRLSQPLHAARLKAGYFSPEDYYEVLVDRLAGAELSWLDVGCGRAPFPNNLQLSAELSESCGNLVGIDPDPSIHENRFIHERRQVMLDDYSPRAAFDIVTARMVVEHVKNPYRFAAALARVTKPGSLIVIFTINWWPIMALAAYCSPMWLHHRLKRHLWNTDARDTFQTTYKMNRRAKRRSLMMEAGLEECHFELLPDASLFWRIPIFRRPRLRRTDFRAESVCRM